MVFSALRVGVKSEMFTCFSTFPRRPIMLGSSGNSSLPPLGRSLSAMGVPLPTIWSTLPGATQTPVQRSWFYRRRSEASRSSSLPGLKVLNSGKHVQVTSRVLLNHVHDVIRSEALLKLPLRYHEAHDAETESKEATVINTWTRRAAGSAIGLGKFQRTTSRILRSEGRNRMGLQKSGPIPRVRLHNTGFSLIGGTSQNLLPDPRLWFCSLGQNRGN